MKTTRTLFSVIILVAVVIVVSAQAKGAKTVQVQNVPVPLLKAGFPGGVERLVMADLMAMQKGSYILHVRDGKVTKVPAEKSTLPSAPRAWSSQGIVVSKADDDTVYVRQDKIMCKSTDGGRTWTSHPDPSVDQSRFQVLSDGSLISVFAAHGPGNAGPAAVHLSMIDCRCGRSSDRRRRSTETNDGITRFLRHPVHDEFAGSVRTMPQPDPIHLSEGRRAGQQDANGNESNEHGSV